MTCFYPLSAFQLTDKRIVFSERHGLDVARALKLPCGQCVGCKLERSRQWAVRCMHEASLHEDKCLITLSYNDENLPENGNLVYSDFQCFIRSLRKRTGRKIRYYMCGEYGEDYGRPHFHSLIFGYSFPDRSYFKKSPAGFSVYTSKELESVWTKGFSGIGEITFESAAYVARYCISDRGAEFVCDRSSGELIERKREFNHMSLKPGIGAGFYDKFYTDIFPHGYVVVNGVKASPPKYYLNKFKEDGSAEEVDGLDLKRQEMFNPEDATPERLAVREVVCKARLAFKKRGLAV